MIKRWVIVGLVGLMVGRTGRAEIEVTEPVPASASTNSSAVAATPELVASPVDGDVLKFLDGDSLHGTVLGATAAGVWWRRSDVKSPILLDLASVSGVMLAKRMNPSPAQRTIAELTNGDALGGELVSLNDKTLTLKTWYAGTLAIQRAMLERLRFIAEASAATYTGPNSLDEWKNDGNRNGAWNYKKGALYGFGGGSLGRDVKLPDVARIDFDLAWRGQLYCSVGFGFDDVKQIYQSGGYMVQMNYSSINLQRYRPNNGNNNLGSNVEVPELQRKSKLHVSIRVNKPKKIIALFFDGNLVKQWNEAEDWVARGTGLVLLSQGQGQFRISNIAVTSWDGRLDTDTGGSAKDTDLLRLNNGDKVSGVVKSIANGQVMLAASFAEMNVPLDRIVTVEFASAKSERARRNAADILAFFPDGRRWTLALDKLDEQNLTGSNETCGRITAALGAFRRIQFHIYDKHEANSDEDEWSGGSGEGGEMQRSDE